MESMDWSQSTVLVTGGTGSFGKKFLELVLKEKRPRKLIVFSRDELKQHEMRQIFPDNNETGVRYFIGDVRDKDRLHRAFNGVDIVVHAAALKQVPACEYNPFEAIQTNVIGAQNIIDAALENNVSKVLAISTDKAVSPVNLYGATKLVAEKLFVQSNVYSGENKRTRFACARYGNVVGSRGSVVPLFLKQKQTGKVTITDLKMTRFWLTLDQGIKFVTESIDNMIGGEIFVPKIPSMSMDKFADAIAPGCDKEIIGIRPGEKLHEVLISADESRYAEDLGDRFVIRQDGPWTSNIKTEKPSLSQEEFTYASNNNTEWLNSEELLELIGMSNAGKTPVGA